MPLTSLHGTTALITGASRGLGRHIARALAAEGVELVLAARTRAGLETLATELRSEFGRNVCVAPTDVGDRVALSELAERSLDVDVLVNNAGIETPSFFHELPLEEMEKMLQVNLVAPMVLTRLLLPGMLARGRGHIVNVASLAGKAGPPLAETYAVTKAGLIAFTQSLRASYAHSGVSASVICPGFVIGEGMFADRAARDRITAPRLLGTSRPEEVGNAVVRAIVRDEPERIVNPGPMRLLSALGQLSPRLPEWFKRRMGLRTMYESHTRD
jgi:short-subunit dehydrogenase